MAISPAKSVFTSTRERNLWIGALAVVILIYSTLGLAGRLSQALRNRNLLSIVFLMGFLLIIATIVGSGILRRTRGQVVWVTVGIMSVYGMAITRMFISIEERTHLIEYGIVAALVYHALAERVKNGRRIPYPAILAALVTAILGWVDEGIQSLLPNRAYDLRDVGFNALASVMAIVAIVLLTRVKEKQIKLFRREQT